MKLKSLFLIAAAAIGGIYLTSEEGKSAREALQKKKSTFDPIIKSLIKDANQVLDGAKEINSDEIRENISILATQAKKTLLDIDLEKTLKTIQEAIKVSSEKIRLAMKETSKAEIKKTPAKNKKTKVNKATK